MKKKIALIVLLCLCFFLPSCKKKGKEVYSNVKVIPTVVNADPNEIWASDVRVRPEDIPEDAKIIYVEKGTKIGKWVAPADGFYPYEKIKEFNQSDVNDSN